jgi:hypothetical protein
MRLILRVGVFPIAVNVDEIFLVSDEPDPIKALSSLPFGTGLAHVKLKTVAMPVARLPRAFIEGGNVMQALGEFFAIAREYKPCR